MLTREKLLELLEQHGLSHRADEILSQCKPSIHLSLQYGVDEADIPIGASKMGGSPDVPPDFVWPQWNDTPLTFIAQFRLSDVKPYDLEDLLPEKGMLYFFFEYFNYCEEITLLQKSISGPYKVLFLGDEHTSLTRTSQSIFVYHTRPVEPYSACPVKYKPELTLLRFSEIGVVTSDFDKVEKRQFELWHRTVHLHIAGPMHRLLGKETDIHGDSMMLEDAASAYNNTIQPISTVDDWRLLLQVDSDTKNFRKARFDWWNRGIVYFWIRKQDLRNQYFDTVWIQLLSN